MVSSQIVINQIVQDDIYLDDCFSWKNMKELTLERADQLELVLNQGGFPLKGAAFSKRDSPSNLPADDCSVKVAEINVRKTYHPISSNKKAMCIKTCRSV